MNFGDAIANLRDNSSILGTHRTMHVLQAAQRSGVGRMSAAVSHLQTIQMAARTLREGIEPPGH